MNIIITKSVSLNLLIFAITKKTHKVEYLEPINSIFIKNLVKLIENFSNCRFEKVKMGKIKTFNNQRLLKIAVARTSIIVRNMRLSNKANSNSSVFDLFNEQILKERWVDIVAKELVLLYEKECKLELKRNEKIIIFEEKINPKFDVYRQLKNLFIIEIFRILVFCSKNILNPFLKKRNNKLKTIKVDSIFLASEPYAETNLDYYLRNQQVLSKNILGNSNFAVIDLFNMRYYSSKFNKKIKKGSILQFLCIFYSYIPTFSSYKKTKYNLNLKDFFKSLLLIFNIWSVAKDIYTTKYFIDSNSYEGTCMLILGETLGIPCYIFQGSLLTQINPYLHNPYANIIGFTNKHIENYNKESKGFNYIKKNSLKINYPYLSNFNFKRINNLKEQLKSKFDLSIAFFDENYCRENLKDMAIGSFFYEDFKKDLKIILSIANSNPKIALIFKSQFISNTIINLIKKDKDLKTLFKPNQIFDISIKTKHSDRNIITPAEIAQSVDLSISNTMGGTAGFEASTVDCRTIFIKSGLSSYDEILPKNVILNDLYELKIILKKIKYSREFLYKSDIGKIERDFLIKI